MLLGARLRGGEVFELSSDLGGGKTTFVRGLVAGTGSTEAVSSPSFTLSRVYTCPTFTVHHFDFYRLPDPGIMSYELDEVIDADSVVIVEWAGIVESVLPDARIRIEFERTGDESRNVVAQYPAIYSYLFEGLTP